MSGEKKGDEDYDFSKFAYHLAGRDASFIMGAYLRHEFPCGLRPFPLHAAQ